MLKIFFVNCSGTFQVPQPKRLLRFRAKVRKLSNRCGAVSFDSCEQSPSTVYGCSQPRVYGGSNVLTVLLQLFGVKGFLSMKEAAGLH